MKSIKYINCEICKKNFAKYSGFSYHLNHTHNLTSEKYYLEVLKKKKTKCVICGKNTWFLNVEEGYKNTCSLQCSLKLKEKPYSEKFHKNYEIKQCKYCGTFKNLEFSSSGCLSNICRACGFAKRHNAHKFKKLSDKQIAQIKKNNKGRKVSLETRKKQSKSLKGRIFSEEHKSNLSKSLNGKYKGVKKPEGFGEKVSKGLKGRKYEDLYGAEKAKVLKHNISVRSANNKYRGYVKNYYYKEYNFRSKWEVQVAKWLDNNNIKYEYESENCKHDYGTHIYIIDFYLSDLNKYIEVKGWWHRHAKFKYNHACKTKNMCIVDSRNIDNINLDIKYVPD